MHSFTRRKLTYRPFMTGASFFCRCLIFHTPFHISNFHMTTFSNNGEIIHGKVLKRMALQSNKIRAHYHPIRLSCAVRVIILQPFSKGICVSTTKMEMRMRMSEKAGDYYYYQYQPYRVACLYNNHNKKKLCIIKMSYRLALHNDISLHHHCPTLTCTPLAQAVVSEKMVLTQTRRSIRKYAKAHDHRPLYAGFLNMFHTADLCVLCVGIGVELVKRKLQNNVEQKIHKNNYQKLSSRSDVNFLGSTARHVDNVTRFN